MKREMARTSCELSMAKVTWLTGGAVIANVEARGFRDVGGGEAQLVAGSRRVDAEIGKRRDASDGGCRGGAGERRACGPSARDDRYGDDGGVVGGVGNAIASHLNDGLRGERH